MSTALLYRMALGRQVLVNARSAMVSALDHVHDVISRYDIGDNVTISNVNVVAMKGSSTFGIGVRASVLNETGGMEVPISRDLTAQTAYMFTLIGRQDGSTSWVVN